MTKRQGWYMYETIGFIPLDHSSIIKYRCSNCDYMGAFLLPSTMYIDDEPYCSECNCVITNKEQIR